MLLDIRMLMSVVRENTVRAFRLSYKWPVWRTGLTRQHVFKIISPYPTLPFTWTFSAVVCLLFQEHMGVRLYKHRHDIHITVAHLMIDLIHVAVLDYVLKGWRYRIYFLLLWCTQQLTIYLPYCWLALQYIKESSSFIDWQFECLFICLMFKTCFSKCYDKLAAKHTVLFCLALVRTKSLCEKTVLLQTVKYIFLGYKLICNISK